MWNRDVVVRWHRGRYADFQRATCSVCGNVGMVARAVVWEHWDKQPCYYCGKQ